MSGPDHPVNIFSIIELQLTSLFVFQIKKNQLFVGQCHFYLKHLLHNSCHGLATTDIRDRYEEKGLQVPNQLECTPALHFFHMSLNAYSIKPSRA